MGALHFTPALVHGWLFPVKQTVFPSAPVAKECVFFHSNELLSPKVLDLDTCFR